jgi:transposase-like protein
MNQRERDALDRHITGNYGESQFADCRVCPKCESEDIVKSGFVLRKGGKVQRYQCNECGYPFTDR